MPQSATLLPRLLLSLLPSLLLSAPQSATQSASQSATQSASQSATQSAIQSVPKSLANWRMGQRVPTRNSETDILGRIAQQSLWNGMVKQAQMDNCAPSRASARLDSKNAETTENSSTNLQDYLCHGSSIIPSLVVWEKNQRRLPNHTRHGHWEWTLAKPCFWERVAESVNM